MDGVTKEEIREGIETILDYGEIYRNDAYLTGKILDYLHSQGVVRKVDRELPNDCIYRSPKQEEAYCDGRDTVIQAGYVAVEPLI